MSISKTISTLSLALAMFGGALVIAPSQAEAANHISNEALKRNKAKNTRPQPANPWSRPCNAQNKCRN